MSIRILIIYLFSAPYIQVWLIVKTKCNKQSTISFEKLHVFYLDLGDSISTYGINHSRTCSSVWPTGRMVPCKTVVRMRYSWRCYLRSCPRAVVLGWQRATVYIWVPGSTGREPSPCGTKLVGWCKFHSWNNTGNQSCALLNWIYFQFRCGTGKLKCHRFLTTFCYIY